MPEGTAKKTCLKRISGLEFPLGDAMNIVSQSYTIEDNLPRMRRRPVTRIPDILVLLSYPR
jgi:hypothetical protein